MPQTLDADALTSLRSSVQAMLKAPTDSASASSCGTQSTSSANTSITTAPPHTAISLLDRRTACRLRGDEGSASEYQCSDEEFTSKMQDALHRAELNDARRSTVCNEENTPSERIYSKVRPSSFIGTNNKDAVAPQFGIGWTGFD